jgi:hypothetical protein
MKTSTLIELSAEEVMIIVGQHFERKHPRCEVVVRSADFQPAEIRLQPKEKPKAK